MNKTSETTLSLDTFSNEAKAIVAQGQKFADEHHCRLFDPAHLLAVLLDISDVQQLFKKLNVNTMMFNHHLYNYLCKLTKGEDSSSLALTTVAALNRAKTNAAQEKRVATVFDLLISLAQEPQGIAGNIFKQFQITPDKIIAALDPIQLKNRELNQCEYITNLSQLAETETPEPVIGRDDEVRRLIQILGRRSKNHPLLVGEPGVGKKTIVLSLVNRIQTKHVPKQLQDTVVLQLDTAALLSGAKSRGDVESRMKSVVKSIQNNNVILYVRSIETLLAQGLNVNLHDLFGIIFAAHNIRVITSTTPNGFKKLGEKEIHTLKEFTTIVIEPTSVDSAIEILRGVMARYEKHHNIKIGENAIAAAVKLAKRYVHDRFLPESALDLLDEAASNKMMEVNGIPLKLDKALSRLASLKAQMEGLSDNDDAASLKAKSKLEKEIKSINATVNIHQHHPLPTYCELKQATLTEESIAIVLGEWTGIPVNKFLEGENEKLSKMEDRLRQRVVGQDEAVQALSKSVRRSYVGLRDTGKPIGSFLFLGPSGVGKTEMVKALAEFLFDDEQAMVRVDCSEMQERHMVQRLIGSPQGYQGAEEGGMLTEAVRKRPYCVVLFDEIEKAHPDVFNLLLQVLDDGRLTDGRGRTTDFSNTIVVMTSNIGSKNILETDRVLFGTEEGRANLKAMLHNEVKKFLRPEFINRIDEIVVFRPLAKEQLNGILDIQLLRLNDMLADREITVKVSDAAKQHLVELGYEPAYGARPLKRVISRHIQDPLSEAVVKGKCNNGTRLRVLLQNNNFVIEEI